MALKDKVILVTGGTSGIGEGCVRHFASLGARVVIASNQQDRGDALEVELRATGHDVLFVFTDVAREESVKSLLRLLASHVDISLRGHLLPSEAAPSPER